MQLVMCIHWFGERLPPVRDAASNHNVKRTGVATAPLPCGLVRTPEMHITNGNDFVTWFAPTARRP